MIFHQDRADACLAALETGACDLPAACGEIFEPAVEPGGSCVNDDACAARPGEIAFCSFSTRSCISYGRAALNQACVTSCSRSPDTSSCMFESAQGGAACWVEDGLRCRDGVCAALGGLGTLCTFGEPFDCDANHTCLFEGVCDPSGAAPGAACMPAITLCAGPTYCSESGICEPKRPGGAPCTSAGECLISCHSSGQCTGQPAGATGLCSWF